MGRHEVKCSGLRRSSIVLLLLLTAAGAGCRSFEYDRAPAADARGLVMGRPYWLPQGTGEPPGHPPSAAQPAPTEKNRVSLPAYRIEPPDLLQLEMIKAVPLPPYYLETYDVLEIHVIGTLLDQPIDGYYLIDAEGMIELGAAYGKVRVVGLTVEQARGVILSHLKQVLAQPEVSVSLARMASAAVLSGIYLVAPDGTINLREFGRVSVVGLTVPEARIRIEEHLSRFFDSPRISLDMAGYNSKTYYVITEGANLGDNVVRLPITGNETVLDAVAQIGGLSKLSSKTVFIARPAPNHLACEQVLPVDWDAVVNGRTATNYQLLPGDRVYIVEDPLVASELGLAKAISPLERIFGIVGLGSSATRAVQTLGRGYNFRRG